MNERIMPDSPCIMTEEEEKWFLVYEAPEKPTFSGRPREISIKGCLDDIVFWKDCPRKYRALEGLWVLMLRAREEFKDLLR